MHVRAKAICNYDDDDDENDDDDDDDDDDNMYVALCIWLIHACVYL